MTGRVVAGGLLALLALLLLATTLSECGGSARGFVRETYDRAGTREGAEVYTSQKSVAAVTDEITTAWEPADRVTSPAGVFLRYSDDIIAVHPAQGGGARTEIEVADERRGYGLFFPYVGGWFGSSGRGGTVRGGGPGSGK